MLKIEHLKKHYDKFSLDCSLEVMSGCVTGLIGQNGAGKSTTFKAVLGLISIDGGTVTILGKRNAISIHKQSHGNNWIWAVFFAFSIVLQTAFFLNLKVIICTVIVKYLLIPWMDEV